MSMGDRSVVRAELDGLPDFLIARNEIRFRKEFRTLASEDAFNNAHFSFSLPACPFNGLIDSVSGFRFLQHRPNSFMFAITSSIHLCDAFIIVYWNMSLICICISQSFSWSQLFLNENTGEKTNMPMFRVFYMSLAWASSDQKVAVISKAPIQQQWTSVSKMIN